MKKLNKKVIKLITGIGILSCLSLFLLRYYSQEEVIKANPTQEITIDEGYTPDISMTIPKDAIGLIEPSLDKTKYKDYIQGEDVSRTSTKNLFSAYSSRSNFQATKLQSANNILPLPNGNFVTVVYDAGTVGRQIMYYVKNTGEILGTYDVAKGDFRNRFEDFTNLDVTEKNGKYYFSVVGRDGAGAVVFNVELDPTLKENQFDILSKTNWVVANMSANFVKLPSIDIDKNRPLALNIQNDLSGKILQANEFTTYAPFVAFDNETTLTALTDTKVTIFNPGSKEYGNLNDKPGYTNSSGGASNAISGLYRIDEDNYLVFERAYLYNSTSTDYTEVDSISLYDSALNFKKNLYISDVAIGSSGEIDRFTYFEDLTKNGQAYVYIYSPIKESRLVCIDTTNGGSMATVKSYPKNTSFLLNKNADSISYVASTNGDVDELQPFGVKSPSIVSGDMNDDFSIRNASSLEIPAGTYNIYKVVLLTTTTDGAEQFGIYGSTTAMLNEFDQSLPYNAVETNSSKIFFGSYYREADYAPVLKKMSSMAFDLTDYKLGKITKDEELLKGIAVYDTVDSNATLLGQTWLQDRVNRNVNTYDRDTEQYTQPIDWNSLGFKDDGKVGPNLVTYFATDSNLSKTSTSRYVNKVNSKTEYDETTAKAALHAESFTIKLSDLQALQKTGGLTPALLTGEDTTSTYGNVLAWDLETGDKYNTDVTVDPDSKQLADINAAKKFGKFPLTYTLTKNGQALTRNTFVYVMGENSEQVGKNGTTIFNTDPISLPWDLTSTLSESDLGQKVMTDGNVIAYDFETGEDITSTVVSPVEADITALKAVEPTDKKNPPTTDNPTKVVHYEITRDTTDETATTTKGTTVTVYYLFVTVTINSTDEDGNALYDTNDKPLTYKKDDKTLTIDPIVLEDQIVGKTINFTTLASIIDSKTAATNGTGYEFIDYFNSDNTTKVTTPNAVPIQWKEADATTDPNVYILQYKGTLRFLTIPETMAFDSKFIRAFDQESTAATTNEDLVVGDNRKTTGTSAVKGNWKVNVNLVSDFTLQGEGATATLPDILYYGDTMIKKTEGTTIKTNTTAITKTDIPLNNTSNFKLKIPAGQAQKGTYQATINWGLTNAP